MPRVSDSAIGENPSQANFRQNPANNAMQLGLALPAITVTPQVSSGLSRQAVALGQVLPEVHQGAHALANGRHDVWVRELDIGAQQGIETAPETLGQGHAHGHLGR